MPKTYSHLLPERRIPTEYELTSSQLSYHPRLGTAVQTPTAAFHARHACRFHVHDWDAFRDPAALTYGAYVTLRRDREVFVQQLLESIEGSDYDARLDPHWVALLDRVIAPLRYPVHGLQMLAAYVAHAAPASRIAIASAFQSADELRRVSWFAYRTKQLSLVHAGFGDRAKTDWQNNPALQPLREVIERLLVTYDWAEAFVAIDLVLKPMFDEFFGQRLTALAFAQRDDVLGRLLLSLCEDHRWHAAFACALARHVLEGGNRELVEQTIDRWRPRVLDAIGAASTLWDSVPSAPDLAGDLERVHAWISMQCGLAPARIEADRDASEARQAGGTP